ncbi:GNAT family N-acetyltransferase [Dryocola boscaweniae]|uniref:GNAT family N-acetyltransferase n=1 Tax=Dryocola boscaweniae TaxID=2925397 RepID=UPI003F69FC76
MLSSCWPQADYGIDSLWSALCNGGGNPRSYGICLVNPERIIGFGGLNILSYADISIINLGYCFATEAWGKGLATEFSGCAVKYGFDEIKLPEISTVVRGNHLASLKVLQKTGLKYIRDIHDVKDAPPSLLYSLTLNEWVRKLK